MAHFTNFQPKATIDHTISASRPGTSHAPATYHGVPLTLDTLMRDEHTRHLILQDEVILAWLFKQPRLMRMTGRHPSGRVFAEAIDSGPPISAYLLGVEDIPPKCRSKFLDFARG